MLVFNALSFEVVRLFQFFCQLVPQLSVNTSEVYMHDYQQQMNVNLSALDNAHLPNVLLIVIYFYYYRY